MVESVAVDKDPSDGDIPETATVEWKETSAKGDTFYVYIKSTATSFPPLIARKNAMVSYKIFDKGYTPVKFMNIT